MKLLYLSKPTDKEYDFDSILNYCQVALEDIDWGIDEVYADGWTHVPNGIVDLIQDAKALKKKVTGIVLYSIEELDVPWLIALGDLNIPLYCVLAPYLGVLRDSPKGHGHPELMKLKYAKHYYKRVTSLKIRHGVKASNKSSGAAPFGYDNVEGKLVQNENYPVLQEIIRLHNASVSVSEIAKRVNLNTAQIYGILRTLGGRK